MKIDKILVQGNKRSSSKAIEKYLNVSKGMVFTRLKQREMYYDLWRSGRFVSSNISILDPFLNRGYTLVIDVRESIVAKPIDQPLDKNEVVLLKCGRWLSNPDNWTKDLALKGKFQGREIDLSLKFDEGFICSVHHPRIDDDSSLTIVSSSQEIGIYPLMTQSYVKGKSSLGSLRMEIDVDMKVDKETQESRYFGFRYGYTHTTSGPKKPPFELNLNITPVFCLATANDPRTEISWDGDLMKLKSVEGELDIDGKSGQLKRYKHSSDEFEFEIYFEDDKYRTALNEVRRQSEKSTNKFDASQPTRSIASFLLSDGVYDEWAPWVASFDINGLTKPNLDEMRLIMRSFGFRLLDAVDAKITQKHNKEKSDRDSFIIPAHPTLAHKNWFQLVGLQCIPVADDFFPNRSWPWTVWRESLYIAAGQRHYAGQQINMIQHSDKFGPLASLVTASLLKSVNPRASYAIAHHGKKRLNSEHFLKDVEPLIDPAYLIGHSFQQVCRDLIRSSDEEISMLVQCLPGSCKEPFLSFVNHLRKEKTGTMQQRILNSLAASWENGLELMLDRKLFDLAKGSNESLSERPAKTVDR